MAAFAGASISGQPLPRLLLQSPATTNISSMKSLLFSNRGGRLASQRPPLRLTVSCAAKPQTVEKVCTIVKKQLALEAGSVINAESKFSALGADSLDTVEIVMALEEEFGICVEEESAQSIATVQDAADLIEKLMENKDA